MLFRGMTKIVQVKAKGFLKAGCLLGICPMSWGSGSLSAPTDPLELVLWGIILTVCLGVQTFLAGPEILFPLPEVCRTRGEAQENERG
jgi:hypothetical protein